MEDLCIIGEGAEGSELIAKYQYRGGEQGASRFMWYQTSAGNEDTLITDTEGKRIYFPTANDIGFVLKFKITPVRDDGQSGVTQEAISLPITPGTISIHDLFILTAKPSVSNVRISCADPNSETPKLEGEAEYIGGEEGKSRFRWERVKDGKYNPINGATSKTLTISGADRNVIFRFWYLFCSYSVNLAVMFLSEPTGKLERRAILKIPLCQILVQLFVPCSFTFQLLQVLHKFH